MGGDEARGEHPTGGERHVLAEDDEHRGLERVGAAGHAQVRPGTHQWPEHRVAGERGDTGGRVRVQAHPPAAGRDRRRHGIRAAVGLDDRRSERASLGHAHGEHGVPAVDRDEPSVPARPVGAHLDVVEPGHRVRHEERPQGTQVDDRGAHPVIKPHRGDAGHVFECRLGSTS